MASSLSLKASGASGVKTLASRECGLLNFLPVRTAEQQPKLSSAIECLPRLGAAKSGPETHVFGCPKRKAPTLNSAATPNVQRKRAAIQTSTATNEQV